jgi:hypothetical protein
MPNFKCLPFKIDLVRLQAEFLQLGMGDYEKHDELNDIDSEFYRAAASYRKDPHAIFNILGDKYFQIGLTEYAGQHTSPEVMKELWDKGVKEILRRMDPKHPQHVPEIRYKNYTKPTSFMRDYFVEIARLFPHGIGRYRVAFMRPGFKIPTHIDGDPNEDVKIHIPIFTNEQATLTVNGETRHLPADGSVWYINSGVPHSAENQGRTVRAHLLINLQDVNDVFHEYAGE